MKNLQPALHRKLIKEGKMTAEESQRIVNDWIFQENTNKQMKVIEDSLEERDAMGIEAEERQTEDEYYAEQAEDAKIEAYETSRGVGQVN